MIQQEETGQLRFSKDEFELAFRRYCENGGHSYDPFDIAYCWSDYKKNPDMYDYLK